MEGRRKDEGWVSLKVYETHFIVVTVRIDHVLPTGIKMEKGDLFVENCN